MRAFDTLKAILGNDALVSECARFTTTFLETKLPVEISKTLVNKALSLWPLRQTAPSTAAQERSTLHWLRLVLHLHQCSNEAMQ